MKFTVGWTPSAEHDLTCCWLESRDRQAIDEAVQRIEQELSSRPLEAGESRTGTMRVSIVEPIAAFYSVRADDRLVKVIQVTRRARRGRSK
jgi:mRNA-degrading endonuclease RelE of RelBE toxin-antitoxin system